VFRDLVCSNLANQIWQQYKTAAFNEAHQQINNLKVAINPLNNHTNRAQPKLKIIQGTPLIQTNP